jgi:hypothetical protein
MRDPDLQMIKVKRILFFDMELQRLKIDSEVARKFMVYMFSISEDWIIRILRDNSLNDLKEIPHDHPDLDLITIDSFVKKVQREARKERERERQFKMSFE